MNKWTNNNLNKILCDITNVPAKCQRNFSDNVTYLPLNDMKMGNICVEEETIEEWFLERRLKKGKLLSLKLFVKYTKAYVTGDEIYINSVCAGEMKKHVDYNVLIKLRQKTVEHKLNRVVVLDACQLAALC